MRKQENASFITLFNLNNVAHLFSFVNLVWLTGLKRWLWAC
jgi:hypothetical protein